MPIDPKLIDRLIAEYKNPEDIIGESGLLKQLTKAVLERALQAEMTEHLAMRNTIRWAIRAVIRGTVRARRSSGANSGNWS